MDPAATRSTAVISSQSARLPTFAVSAESEEKKTSFAKLGRTSLVRNGPARASCRSRMDEARVCS